MHACDVQTSLEPSVLIKILLPIHISEGLSPVFCDDSDENSDQKNIQLASKTNNTCTSG